MLLLLYGIYTTVQSVADELKCEIEYSDENEEDTEVYLDYTNIIPNMTPDQALQYDFNQSTTMVDEIEAGVEHEGDIYGTTQ